MNDHDETYEAAWEAEIRRRIAEVDDGTVKPIPWSVACQMIFEDPREDKRCGPVS